ncbi:MAG: EAL domain-containing protein, partial [Methylococcaceae bacterium]|nr:EAL domain-containing protein [Methylococcaceae bacterium]
FIPIAEETGLVIPIGEWVLAEACRQNRLWQAQGLPTVPVAGNLSVVQIRQIGFNETVRQALEKSGLEPRYLELELTESIIMDSTEASIKRLNEIKQTGIQLSIDDFGTGYSSLAYLKRLPIDKLKIDQSFTREIPQDPNNSAIASAIISLGHELGLKVIAEGVETEAQLRYLKAQQCDEIQGYLFSPPLGAAEMAELLARRNLKVP